MQSIEIKRDLEILAFYDATAELPIDMERLTSSEMSINIAQLAREIHTRNVEAGWWTNLETGEPLKRNVGEILMLCVTELAEAMEGHRKNRMDDKLPHRPMFDVEIADTLIRLFDIAGSCLAGQVAVSFGEKLEYNRKREDHKPENRKLADGKKY